MIALVLAMLAIAGADQAGSDRIRSGRLDEASVRQAVLRAATERLGENADVSIVDLRVTASGAAGRLTATPEPGARVGRPAVFSLTAATDRGPRRVGSAVATLAATADYVSLQRAIARGESIKADDLRAARGELRDVPLHRLPDVTALVEARVVRDLPADTVLTSQMTKAAPPVRSGQRVVLRARVGGAEASAVGIATQSGGVGDVVRVVNPDSRRTVFGRVVGPGEIEVVHGS
jgi:flagella basal body P-ring formation protein FlgA